MANTTSNNGRQLATFVREEDLEDMKGLLQGLRERASKAEGDGRLFLMHQYIRLIAMVQPEITRIERRFAREALAGFRKAHKELKRQLKAEQEEAEQ